MVLKTPRCAVCGGADFEGHIDASSGRVCAGGGDGSLQPYALPVRLLHEERLALRRSMMLQRAQDAENLSHVERQKFEVYRQSSRHVGHVFRLGYPVEGCRVCLLAQSHFEGYRGLLQRAKLWRDKVAALDRRGRSEADSVVSVKCPQCSRRFPSLQKFQSHVYRSHPDMGSGGGVRRLSGSRKFRDLQLSAEEVGLSLSRVVYKRTVQYTLSRGGEVLLVCGSLDDLVRWFAERE